MRTIEILSLNVERTNVVLQTAFHDPPYKFIETEHENWLKRLKRYRFEIDSFKWITLVVKQMVIDTIWPYRRTRGFR